MRTAFSKVASVIRKAAQAALLVSVAAGCSTAATTMPAQAAKGDRYAAIVVDANTGKTLFSKNADSLRYPASLTKMMTIYMLLEAMKSGRISKDTMMPVSAYAASRPPTKIGFRPGQKIRVEDAILAMVTKSANDAAAASGEFLGGSEERFAQIMTTRARRLGMRNTTFRNASGLPNMQQRSTAHDFAILGIALREHFPREFAYFSRQSFNFRGQTIRGHNRLLGRIEGVDGIKTGYTNASGYNLVSSVNTDGRKLVAVVMGGNSGAARDAHMAQLIRTYLPQTTRGRGKPLLAAAQASAPEAPEMVASADLPSPKKAPLPVVRQVNGIADVMDEGAGEGDDDKPQVVAMAAPIARPAAKVAEAAIRPTPRAEVPAAPAAAEEVDPVTTASAPAGGWAVQIGSLPSESQARDMLEKARTAAGLRGAFPAMVPFKKGNQNFYRARFVGFASKDAAWDACVQLKRKSFGCYAIAN